MATPPPLSPPREGQPISAHLAYVKRASSENQARHWNAALADDPVLGPPSGFIVAVGARSDGRYPLVWRRRDDAD